MKKIAGLLILFVGFSFANLGAVAAPPADTPSSVLAAVPSNGKECLTSLFKAPKGALMNLVISPDGTKFSYFYASPGQWEWGVIVRPDLSKSIKYAGKTTNGFSVCDFAWSPQSNELVVSLGYEGLPHKTIHVNPYKREDDVAKTCDTMAVAEPDESFGKMDKSGIGVWGVDGKFYEHEYLARQAGIAIQTSGNHQPMAASNMRLFTGDKFTSEHTFVVLTDNMSKIAHVFTNKNEFVESFPLAASPANGWWIVKDSSGELWAKREFPVSTKEVSGDVNSNVIRWVGVDLGKGRIDLDWEFQGGALVKITRPEGAEIVYVDGNIAEEIAKSQK